MATDFGLASVIVASLQPLYYRPWDELGINSAVVSTFRVFLTLDILQLILPATAWEPAVQQS